MVYMGTQYIFYIYMITCGWLGSSSDLKFLLFCGTIFLFWKPSKPYELIWAPHFMLLLSIYVLYSDITYIYHVSCPGEIKL